MKPIDEPRQGGNLGELWKFLNVRTEDRILVVAWLSMALRPAGPYPVLAVRGEQGSAKSMLARCLRYLVHPNRALLRGVPRSEHDLFVTANRSWIIVLDNISFLPPWLSDALCRIATGGGFATRELYSDDEETIFDATRPIILTGISNYIEVGDLRDRAIFLDLPQITPERRQTERDLWNDFQNAAPRLLGALLDTTCKAIRQLPNIRPQHLSRTADFDAWGEAVERSGPRYPRRRRHCRATPQAARRERRYMGRHLQEAGRGTRPHRRAWRAQKLASGLAAHTQGPEQQAGTPDTELARGGDRGRTALQQPQ